MATRSGFEWNTRKDVPEIPPQEDEESVESPAGDGRDSRHQVLAVQLVQANRNSQAVLYASIVGTIDYNPSEGISWTFEGKEGLEDVKIVGRNLDRIYDRLCSGKREVMRAGGETVQSIVIVKAEDQD